MKIIDLACTEAHSWHKPSVPSHTKEGLSAAMLTMVLMTVVITRVVRHNKDIWKRKEMFVDISKAHFRVWCMTKSSWICRPEAAKEGTCARLS